MSLEIMAKGIVVVKEKEVIEKMKKHGFEMVEKGGNKYKVWLYAKYHPYKLFELLSATYGYLEFRGEDDSYWKWKIENGIIKEYAGKIVYE